MKPIIYPYHYYSSKDGAHNLNLDYVIDLTDIEEDPISERALEESLLKDGYYIMTSYDDEKYFNRKKSYFCIKCCKTIKRKDGQSYDELKESHKLRDLKKEAKCGAKVLKTKSKT